MTVEVPDRYGTCETLPHAWSEFQPGYGTFARAVPDRVMDVLRSRLSCDTEPWKLCERCGAFITWNEWYAQDREFDYSL